MQSLYPMQKSSSVYVAILCVWGVCAGVLAFACGKIVADLWLDGISVENFFVALLLFANAGTNILLLHTCE